METGQKTHWKKLTNPDYIGAYEIPNGKDLTVTIEKVVREQITGTGGKKEECTVAYLKGHKPFILNNTNCKSIQKIYKTPYIEEWAGKSITLYVTSIRAFGEDNVECLRVRNHIPKSKELPELLPSHPSWNDVVKAVTEDGYTIDQVRQKFTVSQETFDLICNSSK